ncbi:MAG: NUDIX hydrolase [Actinobacteria bacterium]|nr:NUDIX hydrolase [Actinomycetota bacterium]
MARDEVIRAAGVVLLRDNDGTTEFLAVHRPVRQDWSLPKGKLERGEHLLAAALRECDEETGYTPVLQAPLPTQSYSVLSMPKVVNYWTARVRADEGFAPDDEIDEVSWVAVEEAASLLSYPSDVHLVEQAANQPQTTPLVVLRHAQAMKRSDFKGGKDVDRPLSGRGRSQSKALVPLLDAFGVVSVHSSSAKRCVQTVQRYARHLDVELVPEPSLTEEGHKHDPDQAAARAVELVALPEPLVLCSHRPVLPTILDAMADALGIDLSDPRWSRIWDPRLPPGGFIVAHRSFGPDGKRTVVGLERHTLSGE